MARAIVSADANRIHANPVDRPGDHVTELLERRRSAVSRHVAVWRQTNDTTVLGKRRDRLSRLEASRAVNACTHVFARIRVRDGDRLLGHLDRLECCPLTAV